MVLAEPTCARQLPETDARGNPFLVWSDGENYRLVSPGADGVVDAEWSGEVATGKIAKANEDIVSGNGQLMRWHDPN